MLSKEPITCPIMVGKLIEEFEQHGEIDCATYSGGEGVDVELTVEFEDKEYWTKAWADKNGDIHDIGQDSIFEVFNVDCRVLIHE